MKITTVSFRSFVGNDAIKNIPIKTQHNKTSSCSRNQGHLIRAKLCTNRGVCMYTQLSLPSPWILIKPAGRRLGEEKEEKEEEGGGGRRRSSRQQQRQPATAASDVCERYRYLVEGICVELAYNRRADLLIRNPAYTCPESCILCANTIFSGRLLSLSAPVGPYRWYARILRSSKFLHLGRGEGRQAGKSSRQAD